MSTLFLFIWKVVETCYNKEEGDKMILEIINKKRRNEELTKEEMKEIVMGYVEGKVPDYQMSSFLMAIAIHGLSKEETLQLTDIMLHSGDVVDLSKIEGTIVDKHSTGGVGDKTTIALVPLVAACGVKVAKMSGRGLGHTGGTIDKLESIPGFRTEVSEKDFIDQVNRIGCAVVGQTGNLVPADKKMYALRDVSGTVESIPLIASSIMSKKLASGADKIVIDVKVGDGALMKDVKSAKQLAKLMVWIGKEYNKEVRCVLTSMEQPLGLAIGNGLEVLEAIDFLQGNGPEDFKELTMHFATTMVSMGKGISMKKARKLVEEKLISGEAYLKLVEMVEAQGGKLDEIPVSKRVFSVQSSKGGIVSDIKTEKIGEIVRSIGGGRIELHDKIDPSVGIVMTKKEGDLVMEQEELLKVYLNQKDLKIQSVLDCFEIGDHLQKPIPLIITTIK